MADPKSWRPATQAVRGGTLRSAHGETSEALYLTSGFVYDDAAQAEATFKGEVSHYQYSRFGNPTVTMLESRLAALEGAEACRATATGMAAVLPLGSTGLSTTTIGLQPASHTACWMAVISWITDSGAAGR